MSMPCPQRDALEPLETRTASWPEKTARVLTPGKKFRLTTGEKIFFLGVSTGASLRKNKINLNVAVFGFSPSTNHVSGQERRQTTALLKNSKFGGLISGPDDQGWHWAEGLEIVTVKNTVVKLRLTGHREKYRPI